MEASEILQFTVPLGENPEPADYEVEAETAGRIVDFCEDASDAITAESIEQFAPTTPWIAWQLGMAAASAMAEQAGRVALNLATASVQAAYMCDATEHIYANLLTFGNILLQLEMHEEALEIYQSLLRLQFRGGVSARASAHLALGTIYRHYVVNPRLSLYHYEHGMRFIGPRSDSEKLLVFWQSLGSLYRDAGDTVGGTLCLCQVNHPEVPKLIRTLVKGALSRKLALRSRLLRQGNRVMAEYVKQCPV